jgi:hypothetical protein
MSERAQVPNTDGEINLAYGPVIEQGMQKFKQDVNFYFLSYSSLVTMARPFSFI